MEADGVITGRVLREINGVARVALGPGIPQKIRKLIPESVEVVTLNGRGFAGKAGPFDLAVVEALEVTPKGDLAVADDTNLSGLLAQRWIVATHQTDDNGEPKMVREVRYPLSRAACVDAIITELGFIGIEPFGFELREVEGAGLPWDPVFLKK